MMLWNIIRDFFVQYIFGGYDSQEVVYSAGLGQIQTYIGGNMDEDYFGGVNDCWYKIGQLGETEIFTTLGDWLSTTATIITLILLLIMLFALVRFVIRQVCGLFAKI